MPIFTDPSKKLYYFQEVINDTSLTEEEKQSRLLDLDYNALSRKGDRRWKGFISFASRIQRGVEKAQLTYANGDIGRYAKRKVPTAKKFFVTMPPLVVVGSILSALDSFHSPLQRGGGGSKGRRASLHPTRTSVIRELGLMAIDLSTRRDEWAPDGEEISPALVGEIGLILYGLCEDLKLAKTCCCARTRLMALLREVAKP